jgi:hypothetical protein
MSDTLDAKLRPNPTVVVQTLPAGAILVDSSTGDCFELNRVGAQVWERLQRGEDVQGIIDALALEYSLHGSTISADIASLMEDLARHGILIAPR